MASPPAASRPDGPPPGHGGSGPRHTTADGVHLDAAGVPIDEPRLDQPSLGKLVSDASTHVSELIRGEIELAKLELRSSVKNAGTGVVMFVLAAVVALFSLVYGFQALAEGIAALGVYRWLAFLIVFVFQLAVAALFVIIGIKKVKRVKAPEKTIKTTKETVTYLKSHG